MSRNLLPRAVAALDVVPVRVTDDSPIRCERRWAWVPKKKA